MLKTLHGRLSLALLALFVPIGALYVWSTVETSRRYAQELTQGVNADLAARLVSEHHLMVGRDVDAGALDAIVETLAMTNPGVDLYVLGPTGEVLRASVAPQSVGQEAVSLAPIEAFLGGAALPVTGDNPRVGGRPKVFSVARIPAEGPLEGFLYIVLADELQDSVAAMVESSTIVRLSVGVGLAGLALIFAAGTLIFTLFTRRLKRLAAGMRAFQASNFTGALGAPVVRAGDEVADLERVFYNMAARIAEQVTSLKENDRLRRELVANVSHDLRTPLTALQGYLETAQLETLSETEKQHYLSVAAKHSARLGKLVGELFELAKLEANAAHLRKESFALAELVQDVVGEFQLAAERQRVALSAEIGVYPFVMADVSFIARVLGNLLDNALQHTPPHGTITVSLSTANVSLVGSALGVTVTVRDSGLGISEAELPHIFERYYRAPRTQDKRLGEGSGAGLGLAISQRMLELHGSRLEVSSQIGVGSSFNFQLEVVAPQGAAKP